MRLASRFGRYNSIRRERPLTDDELMQFVPSVFSGDKHESRSERYTYIPTINIINKLRDEGFQPFFACQSRVRVLLPANRPKPLPHSTGMSLSRMIRERIFAWLSVRMAR